MPLVTALAGEVIFPELGASIDRAQLFVGTNFAPAHIVTTTNTPLISLFDAIDHIFQRSRSSNMI